MDRMQIVDWAWRGAQAAYRMIMTARSVRDAESMVHQLEAMGPARRADVGSIEEAARAHLDEGD